MKYIFLFTLSPIQSFIAQARKTQDLYAGSLILSELTQTAAIEAKNQDINLIFPQNTEGGASFPNRFIGTIDSGFSDDKLQEIGQNIENAALNKFREMANSALKKAEIGFQIKDWLGENKLDDTLKEAFKQQINNHLDINWVFHEIKNDDYEQAYKELEPIMAALKNVRLITNLNPEAGRKCSLDGERNALFFGQGSNNKYVDFNKGKIVKQGVWINKNEGLSAVSLLKRTYQKQDFPSTAEIALKHQIDLLNKEKPELLNCYRQLFSEKYVTACLELNKEKYLNSFSIEYQEEKEGWRTEFDEQFIFEENLTEKNILNATQLKIAREIQQQFKPFLTDKYYAIIAFDGDKMGKLLSGETRKDKSGDLSLFQSKVSDLLMKFSQGINDENADNYIWKNGVKPNVIYTGGDDFLGFVNLNDVFEVVKTLRTTFDKQVNQALKEDLQDHKSFTFSMGIAIAHYKTPLSIVLEKARNLEKLAKKEDKGDRDAFAIAALKHSGDSHEAYFNWALDKGLPTWTAFEKLVDAFQNDCSETFVRALDREFYHLQDDKGLIKNGEERLKYTDEKTKIPVDNQIFMIQTELFRLAYKSLNQDKKGEAGKLKNTVWEFFKTEDKTTHKSVEAQNGMEAVKIALFLKRKTHKDKK